MEIFLTMFLKKRKLKPFRCNKTIRGALYYPIHTNPKAHYYGTED